MKRAVFLDRDGVINKVLFRKGKAVSPRKFEEFEFVENIRKEVQRIKDAGFLVIVITNQPEVARRTLPIWELEKMTARLRSFLPIDDIWICPHDDNAQCACRKPKHGMIQQALNRYPIDIKKSFFIGDSWRDMELARNVGCKGILIDTLYNQDLDCFRRVRDIQEAVDFILA